MTDDTISRQAAIDALKNSRFPGAPYVDAGISIAIGVICDLPPIDVVPVVRCGKCRYWDRFPSCSATPQYHACKRRIMGNVHTMRKDFCSLGERKDGEQA